MESNIAVRAFLSTTYLLKKAWHRQLSKKHRVHLIGMALLSFVLNLFFAEGSTLEGFLFKVAVGFFLFNGILFLYRELRILQKEDMYRKEVSGVHSIHERAKTIAIEHELPDGIMKTTRMTNEEAYEKNMASFKKLREAVQGDVEKDVTSVYPFIETLHQNFEVTNRAAFCIDDLLNAPFYRAHPKIEDWFSKTGESVVSTNRKRLAWLEKALVAFQNQKTSVQRGVEGERMVARYLSDFSETMMPLPGIRFQTSEGTVENDLLLFSAQGIFSLEVKNIGAFGDKRIKISNDGMWYEWKGGYWKRSDKDKIFDQVNRHTALTEKVLFERFGLKDNLQVQSIIVIPNANVEIINESKFLVVRPNQLIPIIREQASILTMEERILCFDHMKSLDIGQGTFEFLDSDVLVDDILSCYDEFKREQQFLQELSAVHTLYVDGVNNQEIGQYLEWREMNRKSERSVF